MKATQIRIYLVAPAIAAVLGLGAHMASASPCATPTGAATATSSNVSFKVGTATASCTSSTASFTVPASPNNCGDPICITLSAPPSFSGCKVTSSGFTFNATLTATTGWQICLKTDASSPTGISSELIIPQNGLTATASILGQTCTTTAVPSPTTSATVSGPYTNSTSSVTFTNASVPVKTSGGFPCPSATTSTFSGKFTASVGGVWITYQ